MEIKVLFIESIIAVALFIAGIWFAFKDWIKLQIYKYLDRRLASYDYEILKCIITEQPIPEAMQKDLNRIEWILNKLREDRDE